ncbi:MAG TPA: thiol:disulfide interchange protein DsbA/DsbL [Luteimonas sp.]|nr:thiol:disulfide interchange protein DsbA/DsbL [Luteimonas sp.]
MRRLLILLSCLLFALPVLAAAPPVEGTDYVLIDNGQPYAPLAGKIEVVEVFGYWCPHCAEFQPQLSAWKRTLPADVHFTYVPAVFTAGDNFARAYFAAEHYGILARTHDAMFPAIHVQGLLPLNASVPELAAYYATQGLDPAKAQAYMDSPEVEAKLEHARQFALHSGVEGTPTLIINGRYRITAATHADGLRIAGQLIDQLRAARRAPTRS